MTPIKVRLLWLAASFVFAAFLIWLWHLAVAYRLVNPVFLPAPEAAFASLQRNWASGNLPSRLLTTVTRMFWGWLIASLVGVALGAAIGSFRPLRKWLVPMLEFLRPLPASAIIPVAIAVMGLTDAMVLTVISFGAMWPVLLATIHGFSSVEPRLYEVGRSLNMSSLAVAWKIALPSASPDILAGMRLGLTVALILTVVCEIIGGAVGLGQWLLLASRSFRSADLFAGVILMGALGFATSSAINLVEARLLRWRRRAR